MVTRTVAAGVVLLLTLLGVNHYLAVRLLGESLSALARQTAIAASNRIEEMFAKSMASTDTLADEVAIAEITPEELSDTIAGYLNSNSMIYGMSVALEPHELYPGLGRFCPYHYRSGNGLAYRDLAVGEHDYLAWDWYTRPQAQGQPSWSEPFLDNGADSPMATYSSPIRAQNDHRFVGVATADMPLDWLQRATQEIRIGNGGITFIQSKKGRIIAHTDPSRRMRTAAITHPDGQSASPSASPQEKDEEEFWRRHLATVAIGEPATFKMPCRHEGGTCWVHAEPLLRTGWRIVTVLPERTLRAQIRRLTAQISLLGIAGLITLTVVVGKMMHGLMSPLARLVEATEEIGSGNLDIELPETSTRDEIGALTTRFGAMRDSLKEYIAELKETLAREQRLKSEIEIAKGIQMSMVPGHGETAVRGETYELFATLRPARTVGGDLYHFAEVNGKLYFSLGDVSDKGVPAALFMAKTVTLYASTLDRELEPGAALAGMNDALEQDNDGCTFVTALCGVLDLASGELVMANAGHMNPVTVSPAACAELEVESNTALGVMGELDYANTQHVLEPGTSLILYTDGISEAFDPTGEEYQLKRILASAGRSEEVSAERLGRDLLADVYRFAATGEQSDDITLLVIHFRG